MGAVPVRVTLETMGYGAYGAHLTYWRQRIFRETTHGGSATALTLQESYHNMSKQAVRGEFRQRRDAFVLSLAVSEKAIAFSRAPTPLQRFFKPGAIVAGYIAIGSEADPAALLKQARDSGCTMALPYVTSRAAPMRFLKWDGDAELVDGPFGLKQPAETSKAVIPDIVIVPLVAFDSKLSRLGQGAGHYDRALSLMPEAIAIGLAWSIQQADNLIADPWDIPLDAIITEKAWIEA